VSESAYRHVEASRVRLVLPQVPPNIPSKATGAAPKEEQLAPWWWDLPAHDRPAHNRPVWNAQVMPRAEPGAMLITGNLLYVDSKRARDSASWLSEGQFQAAPQRCLKLYPELLAASATSCLVRAGRPNRPRFRHVAENHHVPQLAVGSGIWVHSARLGRYLVLGKHAIAWAVIACSTYNTELRSVARAGSPASCRAICRAEQSAPQAVCTCSL